MDKLSEIANKLGTDKGTTAFCCHSYTITYNELFKSLLTQHVDMLEIGVADPRFPGASLKMWKEYFPNLSLTGFDINPDAKKFEEYGVNVFIGDQNEPTDLETCANGKTFDIIIDDGSHYSEHIITSFETLFPYLKPNGWYIVEDLHSVYTKSNITLPAIDRIIEENNFNLSEKRLEHSGKLLIMKKAS